jgi:uncharacterized damage-inducible protein DinB
MTVAELRRLFEYDSWANCEVSRVLQALAAPPEKSVRWLAHIVGTQWLWLGRLRGAENPAIVWPELTLQQSASQLEELRAGWHDYLESLSDRDLGRQVAYVNSKAERWSNAAGDVLIHTVMHGVYHRGQIASDMRAAGQQPAYTDYIEAVRRGHAE